MTQQPHEQPAILGGAPVRPQGPPGWPPHDPDVAHAIEAALADGSWGRYHGPHVAELTRMLAEYQQCEHALLTCSGTVAVELALRGLRVGPGDEVILSAYDFHGNYQNVLIVGATPVLVDVHPQNGNFDPAHLDAATSEKTKAIIVSHLHGGLVPMREVMEFAAPREIGVIEDACQMPGARVEGQWAGDWGDIGVFSFGGSKLLTAGRGGALVTKRPEIAQRIKLYTQRGNDAYPLSELQAAALIPQIEKLDAANAQRAENVEMLCHRLQEIPGLSPFENSVPDSQPGYYKLGLWYDPAAFGGLPRERFSEAMRAEGIALDPGFTALHKTHSSRRFRAVGELQHATDAHEQILTLHHPVLSGTADDVDEIMQAATKLQNHADQLCETAAQP